MFPPFSFVLYVRCITNQDYNFTYLCTKNKESRHRELVDIVMEHCAAVADKAFQAPIIHDFLAFTENRSTYNTAQKNVKNQARKYLKKKKVALNYDCRAQKRFAVFDHHAETARPTLTPLIKTVWDQWTRARNETCRVNVLMLAFSMILDGSHRAGYLTDIGEFDPLELLAAERNLRGRLEAWALEAHARLAAADPDEVVPPSLGFEAYRSGLDPSLKGLVDEGNEYLTRGRSPIFDPQLIQRMKDAQKQGSPTPQTLRLDAQHYNRLYLGGNPTELYGAVAPSAEATAISNAVRILIRAIRHAGDNLSSESNLARCTGNLLAYLERESQAPRPPRSTFKSDSGVRPSHSPLSSTVFGRLGPDPSGGTARTEALDSNTEVMPPLEDARPSQRGRTESHVTFREVARSTRPSPRPTMASEVVVPPHSTLVAVGGEVGYLARPAPRTQPRGRPTRRDEYEFGSTDVRLRYRETPAIPSESSAAEPTESGGDSESAQDQPRRQAELDQVRTRATSQTRRRSLSRRRSHSRRRAPVPMYARDLGPNRNLPNPADDIRAYVAATCPNGFDNLPKTDYANCFQELLPEQIC